MTIKDRVIDTRHVPAKDLIPDDRNWRLHPESQRRALRGILAEIGYAAPVLARETAEGQLVLIDGHLRQEEADPDQLIPVTVVDLTEEEAGKLLATLDPLGAMAQVDTDKYGLLSEDLAIDDGDMQKLVDSLSAGNLVPLSFVDDIGPDGGWNPTEDTRKGTAKATVGYDLISVWPRDGDEDTRAYNYISPIPRQPGETDESLTRRFSRSPALEVEHIVRTYMRKGDMFIESCAGWFTFSLTAALWGYKGTGVDIWDRSLAWGRQQLKKLQGVEGARRYQVVEGDATDLPFEADYFDFAFCNPPWVHLEKYSDDERDLAGKSEADWNVGAAKVLSELKRVVKPGSLIVTVIADYREKGALVPLHATWMAIGAEQGLILHDLAVQTMRTEQVRLWRISYDGKRTIKAHEYVVVFKKPGGGINASCYRNPTSPGAGTRQLRDQPQGHTLERFPDGQQRRRLDGDGGQGNQDHGRADRLPGTETSGMEAKGGRNGGRHARTDPGTLCRHRCAESTKTSLGRGGDRGLDGV